MSEHYDMQADLDTAQDEINSLRAEAEQREALLQRALTIITDAIMHGMPVTKEVAAVRNEILKVEMRHRVCQDCEGDGYFKGPRLGDEACPGCEGRGYNMSGEGNGQAEQD